jgi:hypothetical protein
MSEMSEVYRHLGLREKFELLLAHSLEFGRRVLGPKDRETASPPAGWLRPMPIPESLRSGKMLRPTA